jgi:transketolase
MKERIREISKKFKLGHNGSNLTAVDIISDIYHLKGDNPFILSSGHSGLALYVVLEQYGADAEQLYLKHGTHPTRDEGDKIYCSTGSLGMGLSVAVGMAMAGREVYCLISDGESFEGVIYEASNVIKKYNLTNLKLFVNFNNWGAYDHIPNSHKFLIQTLFPDAKIYHTNVKDHGLEGQSAHYLPL